MPLQDAVPSLCDSPSLWRPEKVGFQASAWIYLQRDRNFKYWSKLVSRLHCRGIDVS